MSWACFLPCGNGSHGARRAFFGVFCSSGCLHMIRRRQRWPSDIPSDRFGSDFAVFRSKGRRFRYVGSQNDAAPYGFAHLWRCRRGRVAEYSVFCTVRDGVPQENAAVSHKYMQSVTENMQTEEADSMGLVQGSVPACRILCLSM